jgi:exosortase/archaeosortase family protein
MVQNQTASSAHARHARGWLAPARFTFFAAALAALWVPIVWLLGAQWSIYEQYSYGWAVPFLCLYLAWERSREPGLAPAGGSTSSTRSRSLWVLVLCLFALLPLRVLQEANPLWRLASWSLTAATVGATFAFLTLAWGRPVARHYAFPILFFLIAVPWPSPVEGVVIRSLTALNSAVVVELLNLFGIPALQHFGEKGRLAPGGRLRLVGAGVAFALGFNLLRTLVLVGLTVRGGSELAARWHDVTGLALLVACFISVWVLANRWQSGPSGRGSGSASIPSTAHAAPTASTLARRGGWRLAVAVALASLLTVAITEGWFRLHERRFSPDTEWQVAWPENAARRPNALSISDSVRGQLLYDHGTNLAWSAAGLRWQLFYFRWLPAADFGDRTRVHLAKSHRPEICLPASGRVLRNEHPHIQETIAGRPVAFRVLEFSERGETPLFVFHAVREDAAGDTQANMRATHRARFAAAWAGQRGLGQRAVQVALWGAADLHHAITAFRQEIPARFR